MNILWEPLQKSSKNVAALRQSLEELWFSSSGEKNFSVNFFWTLVAQLEQLVKTVPDLSLKQLQSRIKA